MSTILISSMLGEHTLQIFERVPEVAIIGYNRPESRIHDRLGKGNQQQEILEIAAATPLAKARQRASTEANIGKVRYNSLRILELRERAYIRRSESSLPSKKRIYHPDKHNSGFTGMSDEEAVEFFQHLNNAHSYLREIM